MEQFLESPRNRLVLFQPAFFPARLQKAKEVRSQPYHRLKFNRIEQRVTLMRGKPESRSEKGKPKAEPKDPP
jgi:hypothetical protein